jgi:hypothetical protein
VESLDAVVRGNDECVDLTGYGNLKGSVPYFSEARTI